MQTTIIYPTPQKSLSTQSDQCRSLHKNNQEIGFLKKNYLFLRIEIMKSIDFFILLNAVVHKQEIALFTLRGG